MCPPSEICSENIGVVFCKQPCHYCESNTNTLEVEKRGFHNHAIYFPPLKIGRGLTPWIDADYFRS